MSDDRVIIFFGFLAFLGLIAYLVWSQQNSSATQNLVSLDEIKRVRETWKK